MSFSSLSDDDLAVLDEAKKCHRAIAKACGIEPRFIRAPGSAMSESQRALIKKELGYETIGWSVDSLDWKRLEPKMTAAEILEKAHPGAIVVLHDREESTPTALKLAIEGLRKQGYAFSTISELVSPQLSKPLPPIGPDGYNRILAIIDKETGSPVPGIAMELNTKGRVLAPDGTGVPGARIWFIGDISRLSTLDSLGRVSHSGSIHLGPSFSIWSFGETSDSEGYYEFTSPNAAELNWVSVVCSAEGFAKYELLDAMATIEAEQNTGAANIWDIQLSLGVLLCGRVIRAANRNGEGTFANLYPGEQLRMSIETRDSEPINFVEEAFKSGESRVREIELVARKPRLRVSVYEYRGSIVTKYDLQVGVHDPKNPDADESGMIWYREAAHQSPSDRSNWTLHKGYGQIHRMVHRRQSTLVAHVKIDLAKALKN